MIIKSNSNSQVFKCNYKTQWLHDGIMLMHDRTRFLSICVPWSKVPYNIVHNEKLECPEKLLDTLRVKSGNLILYVAAVKTKNYKFNISFQFLKPGWRMTGGPSCAWVYCMFYLPRAFSIFLISTYSFLYSSKIAVVVAIFSHLQGTTMEHNLDVYHMFFSFS